MLRKLRALWMRLFGRHADDFDAELESHLAMHIEDGVRAGMTPEQARRMALIALGGTEQTRQAVRERDTLPWIENVLRDVRYALRGFVRNPIFSITVIATLALGIGATTAVFSVVDRILFRPYAHSDRLVSFGLTQTFEQEFILGGFYYEWRDHQQPFKAVTFEQGVSECDLTEHNPLHLHCGSVAGNFLSTLGVSLTDWAQLFTSGGRAERTKVGDYLRCALAWPLQSRPRSAAQDDRHRRSSGSDRRCPSQRFRDAAPAIRRHPVSGADGPCGPAHGQQWHRVSHVGVCATQARRERGPSRGRDGAALPAYAAVDTSSDSAGFSSAGAFYP